MTDLLQYILLAVMVGVYALLAIAGVWRDD